MSLLPSVTNPDLDTAKTLYNLLERMTDGERLKWLRECCRRASAGSGVTVAVIAPPANVQEFLIDFYTIVGKGNLTFEVATKYAENIVKRK